MYVVMKVATAVCSCTPYNKLLIKKDMSHAVVTVTVTVVMHCHVIVTIVTVICGIILFLLY